jgi:hypothetical protein
VELNETSAVIRLVEDDIRLGHLLALIPFTSAEETGRMMVSSGLVSVNLAGFLAFHHFNERSNAVVTDLSSRLKDCNFFFTTEMVDTKSQLLNSVGSYLDLMEKVHSLRNPHPVGIAGTGRSSTSVPVSILGGIFGTPMVSCCASSSALENRGESPYFARTISIRDAEAVAAYYNSLGVSHFGVLYFGDEYGRQFAANIRNAGKELGITASIFPFQPGETLDNAISFISDSGLRYFFGIFFFTQHAEVMTKAFKAGVMGNSEYSWIFSESMSEMLSAGYTVDEFPIAAAVNGSGILSMDIPPNPRYNDALDSFHGDKELQQ